MFCTAAVLLSKRFNQNSKTPPTPCIRFPCLCVFHLDSINDHYSKLPKNTAPAGFKCPTCQAKIFPALNAGGPLATQVKEKLKGYAWARTGLGLPLLKNVPEVQSSSPAINIEKHQGIDQFVSSELHGEPSGLGDTKSTIKQRKQVRYQDTEITMPEESGQSGSAQNNRGDLHSKGTDQDTNQLLPPTDPNHQNNDRAFRPPTGTHRTPDVDFKAFKYRRKSIAQRIKRLLQNHYSSQKYYEPIMGQTTPILVTLVIRDVER